MNGPDCWKASACATKSAMAASPARAAVSRPASCNAISRSCRRPYAFDFLLYCQRNQRACPVLEVTDPGDPVPRKLAPSADLRTDCARYSIYRDGVRAEDRTDITDLWRDDLVSFLIGSGITFDAALERAGVPTHDRWVLRTTADRAGRAVPRRSDRHHALAYPAAGDHRGAGDFAISVQSRRADPYRRSGRDRCRSRKNRCSADRCRRCRTGCPVFWACGVTPQSAAENARLPFFIVHAPAHSFITDLPAQS